MLTQARLDVSIYQRALAEVAKNGSQGSLTIGDVPATRIALTDRLERAYRDQAALEPDAATRVALVDRANQIRRWSLL